MIEDTSLVYLMADNQLVNPQVFNLNHLDVLDVLDVDGCSNHHVWYSS